MSNQKVLTVVSQDCFDDTSYLLMTREQTTPDQHIEICSFTLRCLNFSRKMSHFMMKKYSRKSKDSPTKNNKKLPPPSKAVEPMSLNNSGE